MKISRRHDGQKYNTRMKDGRTDGRRTTCDWTDSNLGLSMLTHPVIKWGGGTHPSLQRLPHRMSIAHVSEYPENDNARLEPVHSSLRGTERDRQTWTKRKVKHSEGGGGASVTQLTVHMTGPNRRQISVHVLSVR